MNHAGLTTGWNGTFWNTIGLQDLVQDDYRKIGTVVLPPGSPVGNGLSETSAMELGLPVKLPVATAIIDAHAGGLGKIFQSICTSTRTYLPCYSKKVRYSVWGEGCAN